MRAARFHGVNDIRIEQVPEPQTQPGTVKIKVHWCGICGTDLHEYTHGPIFCPSPQVPHPLTGETSPVILGHEFSGEIVELGDGVDGFTLGERVCVEPRVPCRKCAACQRGNLNCCQNVATIGLSGGGGGLAEYIVVESSIVHSIQGLSYEAGALVEPLAVAHHAIGRAGKEKISTAVVYGAGPIGLLITAILNAQGCDKIVVMELSTARRERVLQAGASSVLDPREAAFSQDLAALLPEGAQVAFECSGVDSALASAVEIVQERGTVVNVAIRNKPATVDLLPLVVKEILLVGTICYDRDHAQVIELLRSGVLDVDHLVTSRIELEDLVDGGFKQLLENNDAHAKILVRP